MNPSTALGLVLVDELVRCGVREAVLAPGSRSAPLALALHEADAAGRIRLHVRVDERAAAFLALGLAKCAPDGAPVVVVTTSGTAAANLHPAVLEASESGVPLVLLTADRPPELRGSGANQTVDQIKLYAGAVRLFHEVGVPQARPGQVGYWRALVARAVAVARGTRTADPGPVHLNVALREPLVAGPDDGPDWPEPLQGRPDGAPWTAVETTLAPQDRSATPPPWPERTLVIVGDAPAWLGQGVRQLSEAHGWPVVSEASGNARDGAYALRCGHLLLANEAFMADHAPQRLLVVGHPTLHRGVTALLSRPDVVVDVVAPNARWADAGRTAARVLRALPPADTHPGPGGRGRWLRAWTDADRRVSAAVDEVLDASRGPAPAEPALARDLLAALPPGALLVAGSSLPVRDLCLARPRAGVTVLANRGASGIDGTVSTAVGAALAWQRAGGGPAFALLGDLTFVHDAGGLLIGPKEPRPDLAIVVVNNNGGGIFGLLEHRAWTSRPTFDRVFGTPVGVDLAAWCAASGTPHTRVASSAEAVAAALDPRAGLQVVEVRTDRAAAGPLADAIRRAVHDAVGAALAGPRFSGPG